MKSKLLKSLMLISTLVLVINLTSASADAVGHEFADKDAIWELIKGGVNKGGGDGKFNPTGSMTRQIVGVLFLYVNKSPL